MRKQPCGDVSRKRAICRGKAFPSENIVRQGGGRKQGDGDRVNDHRAAAHNVPQRIKDEITEKEKRNAVKGVFLPLFFIEGMPELLENQFERFRFFNCTIPMQMKQIIRRESYEVFVLGFNPPVH